MEGSHSGHCNSLESCASQGVHGFESHPLRIEYKLSGESRDLKRFREFKSHLLRCQVTNIMYLKKIINIILVILFVVALPGIGAFYYLSKKQVAPAVSPNMFARLESFIEQSAQQIADPLYGVALPEAKNTPTVKNSVPDEKTKTTLETPTKSAAVKNDFSCGATQDFNCYEKYYRALVKNESVAAAFADLKARYTTPYVKAMCHPLTHIIGQAATDKYSDVSQAYIHGDSFCWSGYYHGVLEGVAFKMGKAKLVASLNDICVNVPGKEKYSFDYYNCVHGLGHGLMAMTDDELFDSLKFCDTLSGSWNQQSCYGGVFMENVIVDNKNHFTKYLKPSEPLYPCSAVEDRYKGTCYLMQTSYMLKVTNEDFGRVFELCSQVGNPFSTMCYQSLGRDASGRSVSNVQATKNNCDFGKTYDQRSNCIMGAVRDFISYYHSDVEAQQLCAAVDADLQNVCTLTATSYYKTFQ